MSRLFLYVLICIFSVSASYAQQTAASGLGWQLGVQTWSFNHFTFTEALDKADSVGVKYIQAYPGQKIGGTIEGNLDFTTIDLATEQKVLQLLNQRGITMVSYGVAGAKNEQEWTQLFDFAKNMHLQSIAVEPDFSDLPIIAKLAEQYKIKAALHNHPKPSHYWTPDTTLAALKITNSAYVGVNADIGHWVRSGLDPVECLKKLEGHIFAVHMKDLDQKNIEAHDVVWGTGVSNVAAVFAELKRQHFQGPILAEYEYHWENNAPEIMESIKNAKAEIAKLK